MSKLLKKLTAIACAAPLFSFAIGISTAADTRERSLESLSGNYLAGLLAGKARDTEAAAEYFARALKKDKDNPELITRSFMLELGRGRVEKAMRLAAKVVRADKRHRVARLALAVRNFKSEKQEPIRIHLKEAAYTPIGHLTSALLTGWSWTASGDLEQAIMALRKLERTESFGVYQAFHSGLIADFLKQPKRAEKFFERTYESAGGSLRVVQAYGNFLERQGNRSKAIEIYEQFERTTAGHPLIKHTLERAKNGRDAGPFIASGLEGVSEALFSLSSALADQSGVDLALLYAQLALHIRPGFSVAQMLLGDIYEDTKRHQKAIDTYESISKDSPLRTNADLRIAVNYDRIGKAKEAQKRLEAEIVKNPSSYHPSLMLGNLLKNHEKFAEAAKHYATAISQLEKVENKHWTLFYFRGICFERSEQWAKAELDFKKALELRPEQPHVLNYLGYSWIEKGLNLREALGMIERAVELRPNDGYIVDSLGWAHYKLKNFELATKNLERAVELKPQDPVINDHLGDAYWRVGRKLEARFQWMHARDNKPEQDVLNKVMKKLKDGLDPVDPEPATVEQDAKDNKT